MNPITKWIFVVCVIALVPYNFYWIGNTYGPSNDSYDAIELKRVIVFELPDATILKLTLNGTDKGFYDLQESSINYFGEKIMLKELKLISDDYVKFNKTDTSTIEVEIEK